MTHINGGLTAFSYGEVSLEVSGQADSDVYSQSLQESINFVPTPQGGLRKRTGTVNRTFEKLFGKPALIPYRWTDGIERFFTISYSTINLFDSDGALLDSIVWLPAQQAERIRHQDLSWAQSEDVLVITSESVRPRFLGMLDATTISVSHINGANPPLYPLTGDWRTDTIKFSSDAGVWKRAIGSDPTEYYWFRPLIAMANSMSGGVTLADWDDTEAVVIDIDIKGSVDEWIKATLYVVDSLVYSMSYATGRINVYKAVSSGTSGSRGIGHDFEGIGGPIQYVYDGSGDTGVKWQFLHSETVTIKRMVNEDILLPDTLTYAHIGGTLLDAHELLDIDLNGDFTVRKSKWNIARYETGFDSFERGAGAVTFHDGRLVFSGTKNDPYIHGSFVDQFANFSHVNSNQAAAYTYKIQEAYSIKFLVSNDNLMIGTDRGLFIHPSTSGAISNINVNIIRQTSSPCDSVMPIRHENVTVFSSNNGETLAEVRYSQERGGLVTKNLFTLRQANEGKIKRLIFIDGKEPTLYIVFRQIIGESSMLAATYVPSVDLIAFWQWESYGDVTDALSCNQNLIVSVGSGFDSSEFLVVESESAGGLDAARAVNAVAGGFLMFFEHYTGQTVTCLKDGYVTERITVGDASTFFWLQFTKDADTVGIEFEGSFLTQKINDGNGLIQGVKSRIESVSARLLNTGEGVFIDGGSEPSLMFQREDINIIGERVPFFSGDTDIIPIDQTYEAGAFLRVTATNPYPCYVLALWYNMFAEGV